ncbi:MAG: hypothetical protein ACKOYM_09055 [Actinomycetes bacterium]
MRPFGNLLGVDGIEEIVSNVAILSLHKSPLTQPGSGDAGGMNV